MEPNPIEPREESRRPRLKPVSEAEMDRPTVGFVLKLIWNSLVRVFHDPVGMILASGFALIMVWGYHGRLEILGRLWEGWKGPGSPPEGRARILPGVPWDQEALSFMAGLVLLVVVPCILIKVVYRRSLSDFGLGLPPRGKGRLALLSAAILLVASLPAFYLGTRDAEMKATYPIYRGTFSGLSDFVCYELAYLPFFIAIEFIFRGYLLFGLFNLRDEHAPPGVSGEPGPLVFGYYSILISMLSYTAWHLGKPLAELWGTLIWGVAAGSIALAVRTIWPIVLVHWLLNVVLDYLLWQQRM